jgi:tetratricopeptide (TPR) repeat protein
MACPGQYKSEMQATYTRKPVVFLVAAALLVGATARAQDDSTATPVYEQVEIPPETAGEVAEPLFGMDEPEVVSEDSSATAASDDGQTPQEKLDDAHQRFLDYFDDENYQLAIVAAEQTVILTRSVHGDKSLEAGLALANLATVQTRTANYADALTNYNASVFLIEAAEGNISPRLVNPLLGLAATHNTLGEHDRGLVVYQRALLINHVDLGLFNTEQMTIRDGLTESYVGLDEMEDAEDQQEVQSLIVREKHGDDLAMVMPALFKLADWYQRTNQPLKEQQQYRLAINTIRRAEGDTIEHQIEALRGLAAAYMHSREAQISIRMLKQAYRMNLERTPSDPLLSAEILVELGDNYTIFESRRDARRSYTGAWQLLSESGGHDEDLDRLFGAPIIIRSNSLPDVYPDNSKTQEMALSNPDRFEPGYINLRFDISETGRVNNVEIIESDPPELLDKKVMRALSRYIYRPRLAEGEALNTENMQLSHAFLYSNDVLVEESYEETSKRLDYPGQLTRPETQH